MWYIEVIAIAITAFAALGRCLGIFAAKFRQIAYRKRAATYPRSWQDRCAQPEPFLLFALTLLMLTTYEAPQAETRELMLITALGSLTALVGISTMLWSFLSFPSVSTGHYVLPEQEIVTNGPYAWVRHPLYLAALLIWLGLAITFRSLVVLVTMIVYVIPAYVIYIRSEERMMVEQFGEAYLEYAQRVGMLFPGHFRRDG